MRRWCALLAGLALAGAAHAANDEFWPEANLYKQLNEPVRLYFSADYTQGKESNTATTATSANATAAVDVSVQPILRPKLVSEDWERNRYLWARFGYTRVSKIDLGTRELSENRGILALNARAPLPADFWFDGRAQADLRWIEGSYSTRYRLRGEVSRVFSTFEWAMLGYARAEWYYDTRYDAHSRTLYQAGLERTLTPHFRIEVYLARQYDYQPQEDSLSALGLVAKWYY
jgi:hypothetical protein